MQASDLSFEGSKKNQDQNADRPRYDPEAAPLTNAELKAAVDAGMIRKFPRVVRGSADPPIANQQIANLSFMLLKEPKNGVYGFVRVRGVWSDEEHAIKDAKRIIREVDSTNIIHQASVGYAVPITNNEAFSGDQLDVKMRDTDSALRDEAVKDNQSKQRQQQREIEEQKKELKEGKIDDDPNSLDYYTKRKVGHMELKKCVLQGQEKVRNLKKSLRKVEGELSGLTHKHPEYLNEWLANYNKARVRVGLKDITETDLQNVEIVGGIDDEIFEQ